MRGWGVAACLITVASCANAASPEYPGVHCPLSARERAIVDATTMRHLPLHQDDIVSEGPRPRDGCVVANIKVGKNGRITSFHILRYRNNTKEDWIYLSKQLKFAPSRTAWVGLIALVGVDPDNVSSSSSQDGVSAAVEAK